MTETLELFAPESVQMDSPRTVAIREHDIQTHFAPQCPSPWMAIPLAKARQYLFPGGQLTDQDKEETKDIPTITMHYGRLLDEAGLICEADTERNATEMAFDLVLGARR